MRFESISEIARVFQLTSTEPDEMRREIKQLMKSIHPDTTKGGVDFASPEDRDNYYRLSDALKFLDNGIGEEANRSLVPISDITELIRLIRDESKDPVQDEYQAHVEKLDSSITSQIVRYQHRYRLPKISATAATVVLSFIWLFPVSVKDNPALSSFIQSSHFPPIWGASLLAALLVWIFGTLEHERYSFRLRLLQNEEMQNNFFCEFSRWWISHHGVAEVFSKQHIIQNIFEYDELGILRLLGPTRGLFGRKRQNYHYYLHGNEVLIEFVTTIIARAENSRIISQVGGPTLYPKYQFNHDYANEIIEMNHSR